MQSIINKVIIILRGCCLHKILIQFLRELHFKILNNLDYYLTFFSFDSNIFVSLSSFIDSIKYTEIEGEIPLIHEDGAQELAKIQEQALLK